MTADVEVESAHPRIVSRSVAFRSTIRADADGRPARLWHGQIVKPRLEHRQLCTIELAAEGHANRCPGEECAFWDRGCALARVESELDGRPEVAQLLLDLRCELDSGRVIQLEDARSRFAHILNEEEGFA